MKTRILTQGYYHISLNLTKVYQWGEGDGARPTTSGFNTVPSGMGFDMGRKTSAFGYDVYWWKASTIHAHRSLNQGTTALTYGSNGSSDSHFSVRCVLD